MQQQQRFDQFVDELNHARPHEALAMKCPAKLFKASPRKLPSSLPDVTYPGYDDTLHVGHKGFVTLAGVGQVYVSIALAGMTVGFDEQRDGRWLVSFMHLKLGYFDPRANRIQPS